MQNAFSKPIIGFLFLGLCSLVGHAAEIDSAGAGLRHAQQMREGIALFKNQVREILRKNCIECHGEGEIEGDLDLSTRDSLFASGLVGESAENSDLIDSITHRFEPFMPHERDKLDEESIEAIAHWIDLGAPYDKPLLEGAVDVSEGPLVVTEEHRNYWAYRTLAQTELPEVKSKLWPRNEIDHFVLNRLEASHLRPNVEAKRRVLIRRAYLNLIGLPPSPDEVVEFLNDLKPGAYERMIDGLLQSPHYGARWARHWMDIARFAESMGFETDFDRPYAYHYRDFLIMAFNQNMPYDQFVQWQIAGDQLMSEEPLAMMATGFLGVGVLSNVITEKEFESTRYDEMDDMINTLGTAMLGTTIGCARCHDHKYDPITSKDYYELASNFTRTVRTYIDYDPDSAAYETAMAGFEIEEEKLKQRLADYERSVLDKPFQEWLSAGPFELPSATWMVLSPDTFTSQDGAIMEKLWDDSVLIKSQHLDIDNETTFFEFETSLQNLVSLRMETLTHPHLPNRGPGGDYEGGFTIGEVSLEVQDLGVAEPKWEKVALESAQATSQENDQSLSAGAAINGVSQGWSIDMDAFGKDQALFIQFAEPLGFEAGTRIKIRVSSGLNIHQMVGRPRFSVTQDAHAPLQISKGVPVFAYQGMLKLLAGQSPWALSPAETDALQIWYAGKDAGWLSLRNKWIDHRLNRPKSTKTRIMACSDTLPPIWHRSASKGFLSFYETTYHLERGDVTQKGAVAEPGFPQVLVRDPSSLKRPAEPSNSRSFLAKWITDVEAGAGSLLARVFVNRVWHHHFGRGIVETPSDFGKRGGNPSHPELLEWLAQDFVHHGWDVKRLQKLIVTSAAYRQSAQLDSRKSELDVENRLLWRYPPRRAEAEVIRDSLLQVSGRLDPTPFGPGTRDPGKLRRSIYFFVKRGALIPEMVLFDWPEHLVGIGRRASTTIAPQALQFLNSSQTRKYAEGFAERLEQFENPSELIDHAYLYAFNRYPKLKEKALGMQFLKSQSATYRNHQYPKKLALVDYCHSLFSLNEFIYIR